MDLRDPSDERVPEIPVATAPGRRGGGPVGDRLVLAIAAIALIGGALILAGKGLSGDRAVADATGTPHPSVAPSRSSTATPRPRVVTLQLDAPVSPPPAVNWYNGWARAKSDIPIVSEVGDTGRPSRTLKAGSLAWVSQVNPADYPGSDIRGETWYSIDVDGTNGFFAGTHGSTQLLKRYQSVALPQSAWVTNIVAGPRGLLAWGEEPQGVGSRAFIATSSDGSHWKKSTNIGALASAGIQHIAYGPAGWLALAFTYESDGQELWIWSSADGTDWRVLGSDREMAAEGGDATLVGGPLGYLIVLAQNPTSSAWRSSDGVTWTKETMPDVDLTSATSRDRYLSLQAVAIPDGFLAYTSWNHYGGEQQIDYAAVSIGHQPWRIQKGFPNGSNLRVISVGNRLLGVDVSRVTGVPRVWSGDLKDGAVTWQQDAVATASLRGFGITALASDGAATLAAGWEKATGEPVVFSVQGSTWTRTSLPVDAFGTTPPWTLTGANGVFVSIGTRPNVVSQNQVIWHGTPLGDWAPAAESLIPYVAVPSHLTCPAKPTEAAAFNAIDGFGGLLCYGRQPITFRVWLSQCDGCGGGDEGATTTPAWLAGPDRRQLYLSPIQQQDGWWFSATPAEHLDVDLTSTGYWIEVTGHYDDPAAQTCVQIPDPRSGEPPPSPASIIDNCRATFVVTALKKVAGP